MYATVAPNLHRVDAPKKIKNPLKLRKFGRKRVCICFNNFFQFWLNYNCGASLNSRVNFLKTGECDVGI